MAASRAWRRIQNHTSPGARPKVQHVRVLSTFVTSAANAVAASTYQSANAAAALAALQLAHLLDVLRYAEEAIFPRVLFDPLGLAGVGASVAAFLAVIARAPARHALAFAAGAAVAVGFTLYHGIPFDLGVNNPYWGKADAIQWITVIAAIGVGGVCASLALDARRQSQPAGAHA